MNVLKDLHTNFPSLREHLVAAQDHLVVLAKEQDPATFRKALMLIAHRADPAAVADDEAEQQQECYLHISEFGDGLVAIDGVLPKDLGSRFLVLMEAAKRSIRRQLPVGGPVGTEDSSRVASCGPEESHERRPQRATRVKITWRRSQRDRAGRLW